MNEWYFESRDPRGVQSVPKHEEHFRNVRGIVSSLVREITQNSGDAADLSTPKAVHVSFTFGKIERERLLEYVQPLQPHLEAFPDLDKLVNQSNSRVPFLAIEDFNTHGLRGSFEATESNEASNYISFWHRYGESGKAKDQGGRHGLGKSTISSASKLRVFFGATIPSDQTPPLLLLQGQICLKPHMATRSGMPTLFDAYGLWYRSNSGSLRPLMNQEAQTFMHDFNLQRSSENGLSLVIPFCDEELTEQNVIKAVIDNCYHQIITKGLTLSVNDTNLTAQSIMQIANDSGMGHLKAAFELSEESLSKSLRVFKASSAHLNERLKSDHFSAKDLEQMEQRWSDGETVAVCLPVSIKIKTKAATQSEVFLYVKREPGELLCKETYVRGRVSVPLRASIQSSCVALVAADVGEASAFLGDSEPPAHDRWLIGHLREKYAKPELALNRIKHGLSDLLALLDGASTNQPIKNAFLEYFWTPRDEIEDSATSTLKKPGPIVVPPLSKKVNAHVLTRIQGGFCYNYAPEIEEEADSVRIVVSYRRRGAAAASKNAKFADFTKKLDVTEDGKAQLTEFAEARKITFSLANVMPAYQLRVTGFDRNRDIELKLSTGQL